MLKVSTIKEIMENEELKAKLEKIQSEEEFKELCKEYDFSEFQDEEIEEENLNEITGGMMGGRYPQYLEFIYRFEALQKCLRKMKKK